MPSFPFSYVRLYILAVLVVCGCCKVNCLPGLWLGSTPLSVVLGRSRCGGIFRSSCAIVVFCNDLIGWGFSGGVLGSLGWLEGVLVGKGALGCSW